MLTAIAWIGVFTADLTRKFPVPLSLGWSRDPQWNFLAGAPSRRAPMRIMIVRFDGNASEKVRMFTASGNSCNGLTI